MTTTADPILFISGAGLPAWIWDDVREQLRAQPCSAVAKRPTVADPHLTDYVEAAIASAPSGRFAIVAHSGGGMMATEIARLLPDRVTSLLGVSAIVPAPGGSFLTTMPAPNRWMLAAALRLAGTKPPESAIRKGLAGGVDGAVADRLVSEFTPESLGYYRERTGRTPSTVRAGYVHTSKDRELAPAMQRRCAANLSATWEEHLTTGHLPMLEAPSALAQLIDRFVRPS